MLIYCDLFEFFGSIFDGTFKIDYWQQQQLLLLLLLLQQPSPPPLPPQHQQNTCMYVCVCIKLFAIVQKESSSMADPLTEPGEYENLPFHNLQTAPNKVTAEPNWTLITSFCQYYKNYIVYMVNGITTISLRIILSISYILYVRREKETSHTFLLN